MCFGLEYWDAWWVKDGPSLALKRTVTRDDFSYPTSEGKIKVEDKIHTRTLTT